MKKEKLQQLGHIVAGLITIVPGFDSFEEGDYKLAVIYFGITVLFMVLAGLHKRIMQQFMGGDVAFFLLEAVIIFYSGWQYNLNGRPYFYYAMFAAASLFVIFAILSINFQSEVPRSGSSRRNKKRKRKSSSSSFTQAIEKTSFPGETQHKQHE